jgi:hypothetical protein
MLEKTEISYIYFFKTQNESLGKSKSASTQMTICYSAFFWQRIESEDRFLKLLVNSNGFCRADVACRKRTGFCAIHFDEMNFLYGLIEITDSTIQVFA